MNKSPKTRQLLAALRNPDKEIVSFGRKCFRIYGPDLEEPISRTIWTLSDAIALENMGVVRITAIEGDPEDVFFLELNPQYNDN